MDISLPEIKAALAVFLTLVVFLLYHYLTSLDKAAGWIRKRSGKERYSLVLFLCKRIAGFLILGVLPALVFYLIFGMGPASLGFRTVMPEKMSWWIPVGMAVITLITNVNSANPSNHTRYPQIRVSQWGAVPVLSSFSGWLLYLTGYEFLFRGLLLFTTASSFGVYPAVAVNVSLYSAVHLVNGWNETLGAIFFGFLLCLVTLASASILPAILLHLTLSFSTDMFSVRSNPEMQFGFKG